MKSSMSTHVRIRLLVAVAAAVAAPYSASAHTAHRSMAAPFVDSGTLTMATEGEAADLDPASVSDSASGNISTNIYEPLVTLDGSSTTRLKPLLATSWSPNQNKSVWTFSLRHGVAFHTGRCCMTATDVKYSLARVLLAGLSNAYVLARFISHPDQQIQVIDPHTIRFVLGQPQPLFISALTQGFAEVVLDSQVARAHATKGDPWAHAWVTDHDIGTGPYTVQSWQHAQQVVLKRFPTYWGGWSGPHFGTVVVRTVASMATRREMLEHGLADLTSHLTPQDYAAMSKEPQIRVIAPYGTEIQYVDMTEWGPLASPYARQALSYAFNYDAFLKAAFRGYARRAYGPLASTMLGYDPHMFHYQTNLAKARELLRKAGVKPGTTLTYVYSPGPQGQFAGLILQAQLQQLGITLKLQGLDDASFGTIFYGNEPPSRRPNLMAYGWWPDYNDPYDECVPLLASYSAGSAGGNAGFYHNKQVDALLAKMKNADRADLIRYAAQLQDITSRVDPPAIWTNEPAQTLALARSLHGYVFNPLELQVYYFYTMYR